ncbi:Activating molecule in BECN1-regulated autophagy protein 1 [Amphibalanus amphitrite]|uniref:Activating molecule in BECN1-regulated autophagy protein 1 n=1 Tax=Amphibalanus amphitrite TaxID=1232801 RepID=A0A6A4VK20_AMPAM|nr:Activating molecule in BECN1-regulated autophagy protein 1 [Amphibalanus amphitrite]
MALLLGAEEKPADVAGAAQPAPQLCHTLEDRELGLGRPRRRPPPHRRLLDAHEDKLVTQPLMEQPCRIPGSAKSTFLMAFSGDGSRIASTHGDHNIYVTEVSSGALLNTLRGHPRSPWCVAFHPTNSQLIASGCLGGQVRVWDLHNEEPFVHCSTLRARERLRYVKFDPLGYKLITAISNVAPPWQDSQEPVLRARPAAPAPAADSPPPAPAGSGPPAADRADPAGGHRLLESAHRSLTLRYAQLHAQFLSLRHQRSLERSLRQVGVPVRPAAPRSVPAHTVCCPILFLFAFYTLLLDCSLLFQVTIELFS